MSLLFLFGLPASGKTFIGNILQKHFHYKFQDGDMYIPTDMKEALEKKALVTEEMRDTFISTILFASEKLIIEHNRLAIAQTFIKDRHRHLALKKFPTAKFLFVQTNIALREKRLKNRLEEPLDSAYATQMVANFDTPTIPFIKIENNREGEQKVIEQLNQYVIENN